MIRLHPTPDSVETIRPQPADRDGKEEFHAFKLGDAGQLVLPHYQAVALYWELHGYIHRIEDRQREAARIESEQRRKAQLARALLLLPRYREILATRNERYLQDRRRGAMRQLAKETERPYGEIEALLHLARRISKDNDQSIG